MSGLLDRAAALFLTPPSPTAAPPRAAAAGPAGTPAAAVLGSPAHAPAVARLLAAELRLRTRSGCALVGEWRADPDEPGPARGGMAASAARRVADRLAGRGLAAEAQGRLVRLTLDPDARLAASEWERAVAAAACAAVLSIAGPRPPAFDALLDDLDLLVLVTPEEAPAELTDLALAALAPLRPPVLTCRSIPAGTARLLSSSSIATSRLLGPELSAAVRGLA